MLQYRHRRLARHHADQIFAAAGDDEVDVLIHLEHQFDGVAAGPGQQLHRAVGDARLDRRLVEETGKELVALEGVAAAAQDHGVARLERDAGGVDGDVGARFVDYPHHAEGHGDLGYPDPVGAGPFVDDAPDGVVLGGDGAQPGDHVVDSSVGEGEAVELRRGQTGTARGVEVAFVRLLERIAIPVDVPRHEFERADLVGRGYAAQRQRGAAGALADRLQFGAEFFQFFIHEIQSSLDC